MNATSLTTLILDVSRARTRDVKLHALLRSRGLLVKSMRDPRRGAEVLRKGLAHIAVVVLGKRSAIPPGKILKLLHLANSDIPVIVSTSHPHLDEACELLRSHAFDYIDRHQLEPELNRALDRAILEKGFTLDREQWMMETLGKRIAERRAQLELTLKQLATRGGVSSSLMSQIERGKITPSLNSLDKTCRALNFPLSELFADI